jgi:hypothetical protein
MAYVSQQMKKELAPQIKSVLKKYGMKGTIAVDNHSTLVVNLREGVIDFDSDRDNFQVNHYWVKEHYAGVARDFLVELVDAMRGPKFYDNTDIMTDYFDVSHYININVGRFSKPYKLVA